MSGLSTNFRRFCLAVAACAAVALIVGMLTGSHLVWQGAAAVEAVAEAHGDLGSFRTLQKQPAWRAEPLEEQLRRFMGSGGSRKIRYARLLVEALDPEAAPAPLDRVLNRALSAGRD